MANQKLNLTINGKNNAGPAVNSLKKGILGLNAATLGMTLSVGVLVVGITKMIKAASEQERVEAKLAATIKSTSEAAGLNFNELTKMAAGLQKITSFGDEAIIETESLLLTFTKIGRDVFPKALETILDVSVGMGQDLKSSAIQLGKALNDPILGITAMSRVGISFSNVQKQQIKDFVKLGEVAKAQEVILAELNTQFGGQAQAEAATFGGQIKQLTNAFGDLQEGLGFFVTEGNAVSTWIKGATILFADLADKMNLVSRTRLLDQHNQELELLGQNLDTIEKELIGLESGLLGFDPGVTKRIDELNTALASTEKRMRELEDIIDKGGDKGGKGGKAPDRGTERIERQIELLEKQVSILKESNTELDKQISKEAELERLRTELTEKRLAQAETIITFEEALRKGAADRESESLEERIEKRKAAHEKENRDALTLFDALEEDMITRAEFTAAVVAASLDAIGNAFTVFFNVMFTRNKDFAAQMKDVWRGLVGTILNMIGRLIARMLALQVLTSMFPGGAIVGTGFKQIFGRSLMGMFGIQGFQTPHGGERVIPGPPNMPVPFIGHGGETVGRGGGGGFTLVVQGDFLSTEETNAKIFEMQHEYKKRNDLD